MGLEHLSCRLSLPPSFPHTYGHSGPPSLPWTGKHRADLCPDHPHRTDIPPSGSTKTYACSSGDSAPRRRPRCCRCWPARSQSPGNREPGSHRSHRASSCGRHRDQQPLPSVPALLPHLPLRSLEGTLLNVGPGPQKRASLSVSPIS